jgi:putative ABC transport system substrate-binding protein
MESAARSFGRRLHVLNARSEREFEAVFAALEQERIGAMVVTSGNVFSNESATLGQVCARHAVPVIGAHRDFARAGGLMSYGTDLTEAYRRVGVCVARILSGEEPSVLPVELSTKVEFVINLKAAKALGVKIPSGLLAIAHEIID